MKKAGILTICGMVAAMLVGFVGTADARPDYKKAHDAKYSDSSIAPLLKEAKCNACHYGKKKSDRNDYGKALIKVGLTEEKYKELKKEHKEDFAKLIKESLEKVLKEKADGGKTFGELIEAGKLPGTNP